MENEWDSNRKLVYLLNCYLLEFYAGDGKIVDIEDLFYTILVLAFFCLLVSRLIVDV